MHDTDSYQFNAKREKKRTKWSQNNAIIIIDDDVMAFCLSLRTVAIQYKCTTKS